MVEQTSRCWSARRIGLFLGLFLLLFQLPFLSPLDNANVSTRLMLTAAIVDEGTTRIDTYHETTNDKAYFKGHYYSDKAPGMALLAIPAYVMAQTILDTPATFLALQDTIPTRQLLFRLVVLSTSGLLCAVAAVAFFQMAVQITQQPRISMLATLMIFLGTPMFGWSVYFFGHAAAGACLIFAAASLFLLRPETTQGGSSLTWLVLGAGGALGFAVSIEYTAAPAAALIGVYGLWRLCKFESRQALWLLGLGLLSVGLSVVPLMIYHTVAFGGPFSVGYSNVVGFEGMKEGFLGLTLPDAKILYHLTLGVRRGLVWLAPVVILVPVAMVFAFRARALVPEILLSGAVTLYYFLFNASYHYWDGGASLGPRHVTPALPFMGIALLYMWWQATGRWRQLLLLLTAIGFIVNIMSASSTMTVFRGYTYPLWEPVLSNLLEGIGIWSFYEKMGVQPVLAFIIWVAIVSVFFHYLWRRIPAHL